MDMKAIDSEIMDTEIMDLIKDKFEKYCIDENKDKIEHYLMNIKNLANYDNGYFFEKATEKCNLDIIKLFVKHGVDVNVDDAYVLYNCAYKEREDCVRYLIECGADVERIKYFQGYKYAKLFADEIENKPKE